MKRADFIRQNVGMSVIKAMTDEELATFLVAHEKDKGNITTYDECYKLLQEEMVM